MYICVLIYLMKDGIPDKSLQRVGFGGSVIDRVSFYEQEFRPFLDLPTIGNWLSKMHTQLSAAIFTQALGS